MKSMASIAAYWNPLNRNSVRLNRFRFEQSLLRRVHVFDMEQLMFESMVRSKTKLYESIDELMADYALAQRQSKDRPEYRLWQKEAMLNHGLRQLDDEVEVVAWLDCDVEFLRPDWYEAACSALEQYPVVQLFERCHLLDSHGRVAETKEGYQFRLAQGKEPRGGQGYAWAARREVLQYDGLFDLNITGGGDAMMAAAWNRRPQDFSIRNAPEALRRKWEMWAILQDKIVRGNVSHIEGDIVHFYHGSTKNRQYGARTMLLKEHDYDPDRDVTRDEHGLLRWTGANPALEAAVKQMFLDRREDQ